MRKQAEEEARAKGLPLPAEDALTLPGKQYAVIIDEAHSSQSGETATELKAVLASDHIKQKAKEEGSGAGPGGSRRGDPQDDGKAWTAAEHQLLRLHRDAEAQNPGGLRDARARRPAASIPPV